VSTQDRFAQHGEQGRIVALDDVVRTGRYASHLGVDGHLYEFDQGGFWRTDLQAKERERVALQKGAEMPLGPWYHHSLCDCEICGPLITDGP
jgi:hypothetical protein